jgi:hypothetical protein
MSAHHSINTPIRNAFENINVKRSAYTKEGERIGAIIFDALSTKKGTIVRPDWNASLSFKTFKMLNGPIFDVPANKVRMPYDRMCGM